MTTQIFTLPCGMKLLVNHMPHLRSVASGLWINCGSAYEQPHLAGVSHFLEHMLFKGTKKRSALQIASEMEAVGGVLNAFTGKEATCFYARSLDEHFSLQLDLLADMYMDSLIDREEFAREKNVILEEIRMYEDSPDEVALDLFADAIFPKHPYGASISGSLASVEALTRDQLYNHYRNFYTPGNTVLAIAGNISFEAAYDAAAEKFAAFTGNDQNVNITAPIAASGNVYTHKDIEQSHICMGFPGVTIGDKDYYAASIIANALGGGASSRLFQEIREKRGLAYSAYCYLETYAKAGYILAYAATNPGKADEVIHVMAEQFALLAKSGLTEKEIKQSKDQLKGGLLLAMESSSNVMSKLGRTYLTLGKVYNAEETADKLMAVTDEDIDRAMNRIFGDNSCVLAQVGPTQAQVDIKELL